TFHSPVGKPVMTNVRLWTWVSSFKGVKPMITRNVAVLVSVLILGCALSVAQRQPSQKAVERIQKEVRHELIMLPYLGVFDNLAYKVDGYNVTLVGQV